MRETEILKRTLYYFGRTKWDKRIVRTYNPQCSYFHCDEVLRDIFYEPSKRELPSKLIIVTTISNPLYKGFDMVLKTAKILKSYYNVDFEWKVYGNITPHFTEQICGIKKDDVSVKLMGVATAEELRNAELHSTCYVHTSYIDNSPNSLCEAQILGCTCISTYVGGIPSLIENGKTGYLFPSNDPYQLASLIYELYSNPKLNINVGEKGKEEAIRRHDKNFIEKTIIDTYNYITKNANSII